MTREARFAAWRTLSPRAAQLAAGGLTRSCLELGPVSADHYCLTQPELTAGREHLRGEVLQLQQARIREVRGRHSSGGSVCAA